MEKKYKYELTEEERNTLLDCIRTAEKITDDGKLNTLMPEIRTAYTKKQKDIFKIWEKIEHEKPTE